MFNKVIVGTLAAGIILSGAGNAFAAETSTVSNYANNVVEKSINSVQSNAYVDVRVTSSGKVRFYAKELSNNFTNKYYDEIVFTIESPSGQDFLSNLDWNQDIISVTPNENERTGNIARISEDKEYILDKIYRIYNKLGYSMPDTVTIYAYAKPANDDKYWPLESFELDMNKLYWFKNDELRD